ncbi:GAF sensor protein [mine drainage metagenome]|uniref:GAF sensor protein n=1 Tax=mine drainage metagenome TaxID=410659 RepID=T1D8X0_9ZZZZ
MLIMVLQNRERFIFEVERRINDELDLLMQFICDNLSMVNSLYNWIGIYVLRDGKLKLQAFCGKETEHVEINLGDGLCSLAITRDEVVNEPEVKSNTKYLACFPETESELVIPIRHNGDPIGELDIDSETKNAFKLEDEEFLLKLGDLVSVRISEAFEP